MFRQFEEWNSKLRTHGRETPHHYVVAITPRVARGVAPHCHTIGPTSLATSPATIVFRGSVDVISSPLCTNIFSRHGKKCDSGSEDAASSISYDDPLVDLVVQCGEIYWKYWKDRKEVSRKA